MTGWLVALVVALTAAVVGLAVLLWVAYQVVVMLAGVDVDPGIEE